MARGKEKLAAPAYMAQMNAETPAEMATTLLRGVAENTFYVLGGKVCCCTPSLRSACLSTRLWLLKAVLCAA